MSDAKEAAEKAVDWVEQLIAEMIDGDHQDNKIVLGELTNQSGSEELQIQLVVTRNKEDFIDE
jgi:hypothetical protein